MKHHSKKGKHHTQSAAAGIAVQGRSAIVQKKSNSGLGEELQAGIESLSGQSMDDVKVHYNSPRPAQLQAHAFAQGNDIHLATGQERHLPHEAWHVVQQKQGRVKPTTQMKSTYINDDTALETEADRMGMKALQMKRVGEPQKLNHCAACRPVVQKVDWLGLAGRGLNIGRTVVGTGFGIARTVVGTGADITKKVVGTGAGLVGGAAGLVTGAAKGTWNDGLAGTLQGAKQGALDGYDHPLTAVGTLGTAALAATVAAPATVTGLALAGVATTAAGYLGAKMDKKNMSQLPATVQAPVFNGTVPHDIVEALHARNASAPSVSPFVKANVLENSDAQIFWYGTDARTDERVEVTGSATYLHKQNKDWAAELRARKRYSPENLARRAVNKPQRQNKLMSWEAYQRGVNQPQIAPYPMAPAAPWFIGGYNLNPANQLEMNRMAADRTQVMNSGTGNAQEMFGGTYQHDVSAYGNFNWAGEGTVINALSNNALFTIGNVLLFTNYNNLLVPNAPPTGLRRTSIQITQKIVNMGGFYIQGRVMKNPTPYINVPAGTDVEVQSHMGNIYWRQLAAGWHQINPQGSAVVTQNFYQVRVVPEDHLGLHVAGGDTQRARNRDPQPALNDARFQLLQTRMNNLNTPLKSAMGPWRAGNTWNGEQLGLNVKIAEYRRLGGDIAFQEAPHALAAPYNPSLASSGNTDVTNPDWYFNTQAAMAGRFVGGRSNSTLGYMSTGTLLFHQGLLTMEQAKDILAFVIADMVVSGEHSMPECMVTVLQAGAGMAPWKNTGLHVPNAQTALYAWLRLVNAGSKNAMKAQTRQLLVNALRARNWNYELIRVLTILDKVLYNAG
jgi:hypothetical protein